MHQGARSHYLTSQLQRGTHVPSPEVVLRRAVHYAFVPHIVRRLSWNEVYLPSSKSPSTSSCASSRSWKSTLWTKQSDFISSRTIGIDSFATLVSSVQATSPMQLSTSSSFKFDEGQPAYLASIWLLFFNPELRTRCAAVYDLWPFSSLLARLCLLSARIDNLLTEQARPVFQSIQIWARIIWLSLLPAHDRLYLLT